MARAEAPAAGDLIAILAALLCAPTVIAAQVCGRLVSRDRRALMIVNLGGSRWGKLAQTGALVVALGLVCGVFLGLPTLALLWVFPHLSIAVLSAGGSRMLAQVLCVGLACVVLLGPGLLVVCTRFAALRASVVAWSQVCSVPSGLALARSDRVTISGFAAWPQRCGHGSALAEQVLPVILSAMTATGRPIVVVARTRALADVYQRWGLHPYRPGSSILTAHPASQESRGG
jgi:hypothetical protein